MRMWKRLGAVCLSLLLMLGCTACEKDEEIEKITADQSGKDVKLVVWYTDAALTPYMEDVAKKVHEENEKITVENVLVKENEYLNSIYQASVKEGAGPDLFVLSSSVLEEAYLMGMVMENTGNPDVYTQEKYGKSAIAAASYKNKLYGCPFTYNTAFMVYNTTYAELMNTFEQLVEFSDNFQHTEENAQVEIIAQWDMRDIFLNYAFVGEYLNIAGESGDDERQLNYTSDSFQKSLEEFLNLKTAIGIGETTSSYAESIKRFQNGSLLYTIIQAKDFSQIEAGEAAFDVCAVPAYNQSVGTRAMSETTLVMINPYGREKNAAAAYAKALTYDYAAGIYEQTGLLCARGDIKEHKGTPVENAHKVYEDTVVKSQLLKTGDTYLQLEILLHQIWDGQEIDESMDLFKSFMGQQWKK